MLVAMELDYGQCPFCGGTIESLPTMVRMVVEGETRTLDDVPRGVCGQCGTTAYKAEVLAFIEYVFRGAPGDAAQERGAVTAPRRDRRRVGSLSA
jgi:YgiT-type zinc finger domain-containing protein